MKKIIYNNKMKILNKIKIKFDSTADRVRPNDILQRYNKDIIIRHNYKLLNK